jgi:hypothetical protein
MEGLEKTKVKHTQSGVSSTQTLITTTRTVKQAQWEKKVL